MILIKWRIGNSYVSTLPVTWFNTPIKSWRLSIYFDTSRFAKRSVYKLRPLLWGEWSQPRFGLPKEIYNSSPHKRPYERRQRSYADPIYDEVEHRLQIGWLVGVDISRCWSSDRNPFYIDDNGDLILPLPLRHTMRGLRTKLWTPTGTRLPIAKEGGQLPLSVYNTIIMAQESHQRQRH